MENFSVNNNGNLAINGCDTVELAKQYSTPLYVLNENMIRQACKSYKDAIAKYYDGRGLACYASKALNCLEICRIIQDEGLGLDVVSEGELYTAIKSGFKTENIHFHGNNKTDDELNMALDNNVGTIVVDNLFEMQKLDKLASQKNCVANISLRIKPGIDAHTHDYIRTGQIDSKFGFALETGEAFDAVKTAIEFKNINLKELHCHIGSQIFDVYPFVLASQVMMDFIAKIRDELNYTIENLNLGGGFGIKYVDKDNPKPYELYIKEIANAIKIKAKENNLPLPYLFVEPGRSIVGEAGITLYKVGSVKTIPDVRTYISVDGGMTDNIRYALYRSDYKAIIANKASMPASNIVTIAGKCCESGDLIQENANIQSPEVGDILAVFSTGAYNYSMASNYNRIRRPAMVMVKDGKSRVIIKRESLDDLIKNDI